MGRSNQKPTLESSLARQSHYVLLCFSFFFWSHNSLYQVLTATYMDGERFDRDDVAVSQLF